MGVDHVREKQSRKSEYKTFKLRKYENVCSRMPDNLTADAEVGDEDRDMDIAVIHNSPNF